MEGILFYSKKQYQNIPKYNNFYFVDINNLYNKLIIEQIYTDDTKRLIKIVSKNSYNKIILQYIALTLGFDTGLPPTILQKKPIIDFLKEIVNNDTHTIILYILSSLVDKFFVPEKNIYPLTYINYKIYKIVQTIQEQNLEEHQEIVKKMIEKQVDVETLFMGDKMFSFSQLANMYITSQTNLNSYTDVYLYNVSYGDLKTKTYYPKYLIYTGCTKEDYQPINPYNKVIHIFTNDYEEIPQQPIDDNIIKEIKTAIKEYINGKESVVLSETIAVPMNIDLLKKIREKFKKYTNKEILLTDIDVIYNMFNGDLILIVQDLLFIQNIGRMHNYKYFPFSKIERAILYI